MLEWAWATAPATSLSSGVMLLVHVVMISGLWFRGPKPDFGSEGHQRISKKVS